MKREWVTAKITRQTCEGVQTVCPAFPRCLQGVWVPTVEATSVTSLVTIITHDNVALGNPDAGVCSEAQPLSPKLEKPAIHFPQVTFKSAARSKVLLPPNKGAAILKVQSNLKYQISK